MPPPRPGTNASSYDAAFLFAPLKPQQNTTSRRRPQQQRGNATNFAPKRRRADLTGWTGRTGPSTTPWTYPQRLSGEGRHYVHGTSGKSEVRDCRVQRFLCAQFWVSRDAASFNTGQNSQGNMKRRHPEASRRGPPRRGQPPGRVSFPLSETLPGGRDSEASVPGCLAADLPCLSSLLLPRPPHPNASCPKVVAALEGPMVAGCRQMRPIFLSW